MRLIGHSLWIGLLTLTTAIAQTNAPLPPMPQVQTNVTRHFAAPANVRASFTVSFDYTNVIYPFWLSTNLVTSTNWTLATNVSVVTVSASFPVNPAVMAEFVRVGSPTYYGPWSTATNPP